MKSDLLRYEDFVVEVFDVKPEGFRVRVLASPMGGMTSTAAVQVAIDRKKLRVGVERLRRRELDPDELLDYGRLLAGLILPEGWIRVLYWRSLDRVRARGAGLRLRFGFEDLELARYPWEYLNVDSGFGESLISDFLALQRDVSVTRYDIVSPVVDTLPNVSQVRLVAAFEQVSIAPLQDFDTERNGIKTALEQVNAGIPAVLPTWLVNVSARQLFDTLRRVDILHFAGLAETTRTVQDAPGSYLYESFLALPGGEIGGDVMRLPFPVLASALVAAQVRLTFINSGPLDVSGLREMTRAGIPAVVGHQLPVRDSSASVFAGVLYSYLVLGYTIDEAVFRARQALFVAGLGSDFSTYDWGSSVIYLQSRTGLLFPTPPPPVDRGGIADEELPPLVRVRREFGTVEGQVTGVADPAALIDRLLKRTLVEVVDQVHTVTSTGAVAGTAETAPSWRNIPVDPPSAPDLSEPTAAKKQAPAQPAKHRSPDVAALERRRPLVYHDFRLTLSDLQNDGRFRVHVEGMTPGGELERGRAIEATYRAEPLKERIGKLRRRTSLNEDHLYNLGAELADLLLPDGSVRDLFWDSVRAVEQAGEGLRLRINAGSPELAALPWEYTYLLRVAGERDQSGFLALQRRVSITRYEAIGPRPPAIGAKRRFRVVAALAQTGGAAGERLNVEADKRAIETAVAAINESQLDTPVVEIDVVQPATRAGIADHLSGCDIFHFAGHGDYHTSNRVSATDFLREGVIVLTDASGGNTQMRGDDLATLLDGAGVRLAVLGACNTAERDELSLWTGLAPALVRRNVPAVVAMQFKVKDANAARIAAQLYSGVFGGLTIDEAVTQARLATLGTAGLVDADWGVPALYLRAEDGVLLPIVSEDAPDAAGALAGIAVRQEIGTNAGEVIGVKIDELIGEWSYGPTPSISVDSKVNTVTETGRVVGVEIGTARRDREESQS